VIRIRFGAADLGDVRFAARPAPLIELHTALLRFTMPGADAAVLGRWLRRVDRARPAFAPIGDVVPAGYAPAFLDVYEPDLTDALGALRPARGAAAPELRRAYAGHDAAVPGWVRDLARDDDASWRRLARAEGAAFEALIRPVWGLVQDLHQAEFTRHALATAEHGVGAAINALLPGGRLHDGVWEIEAPWSADVGVAGRGLVLLPSFHWSGPPLVRDRPDLPVVVTYPAGTGLPPAPGTDPGSEEALARVVGRTRVDLLLRLATPHTTGDLARALKVSAATVSAHTAALRGAGLITSRRAGRHTLHERTATGTLLVRRHATG
jgi:DNA-binding transcriptional ArsR family regulator